MRRLLALAVVATAAALVPASPASACDAGQNPLCLVDVCRNVNHWHGTVSTIVTDPVPKPVC